MKKTLIYLLAAATITTTSCKQTKKAPVPERVVETIDEETGISSLRELHINDSVTVANKTYTYQFDFTPTEAVVRNPQGDDYYDNQVSLAIRQGNHEVLNRIFTKAHFKALVPSEFLNTSTLCGFTYDYTSDDSSALYFIATVGDADETADMSFPIRLKITPSGNISMEKATDLETEPIRPGMTLDPTDDV